MNEEINKVPDTGAVEATVVEQGAPTGSSFSVQKIIIVVVVILCLGIAGYFGYKIYGVYNQISEDCPDSMNSDCISSKAGDINQGQKPVVKEDEVADVSVGKKPSVKTYTWEGKVGKGQYMANSFVVEQESVVQVEKTASDKETDLKLCFLTEDNYRILKAEGELNCFHYVTKNPDDFILEPGNYIFAVIPLIEEINFTAIVNVYNNFAPDYKGWYFSDNSRGGIDWNSAQEYCANLPIQGSDPKNIWRLPTREELRSMYNNKDLIGNLQDDQYWSGVTNVDFDDMAYSIDLADGEEQSGLKKASGFHVRCIR
jgi:hypothetical protein